MPELSLVIHIYIYMYVYGIHLMVVHTTIGSIDQVSHIGLT